MVDELTDDSKGSDKAPPEVTPVLATRAAVATDQSGITLLFQRPVMTMGDNDTVQVRLETITAIVLSPIVAKDLLKLLTRTIGQFEDWTGAEIPDSPPTPMPSGTVAGMTKN